MRKLTGILSVCVVGGLMWGSLSAETPETRDKGEAPQTEQEPAQIAEEIRQRLHDPISLKLDQVPLKQALEEILTKHGIEFWLDAPKLEQMSINVDEIHVTCNLRNVSYRAALKRVLSGSNLAWECEDTGIRITTQTDQDSACFARVYDVADLLKELVVVLHNPTTSIGPQSKLPAIPTQSGGGLGALPGGMPPDSAAKPAATMAPEYVLMQAIQELVGGPPHAPWIVADGEGGTIHYIRTANAKLLVIKQNEATHGAIEDLLNDLLSHDRMGEEGDAEAAPAAKNASRTITVRPRVRMVGRRIVR